MQSKSSTEKKPSRRHSQDLHDIQDGIKPIDGGRYIVESYLGRGSYGMVVSASDTVASQERVAIKFIYPQVFAKPYLATRILREIMLMAHFNHPNIIGIQNLLISAEEHQPFRAYIVMDIMDMDLHALFKSGQPLTEQHVKFFVVQILAALDCIHAAGVIHRDLTPNNCLLSTACDLKVCDFGLAREQNMYMTDYVVMRWYRAPELIMQLSSYDTAVDIWAAGCILAYMLHSGEATFKGDSTLNQLETIMNIIGTPSKDDMSHMTDGAEGARLLIRSRPPSAGVSFQAYFCTPEGGAVSKDCINLLRWMLSFNPKNRPTAREALMHPYLQEYRPEAFPPRPPHFELGEAASKDLTSAQVMNLLKDLQKDHGWGRIEGADAVRLKEDPASFTSVPIQSTSEADLPSSAAAEVPLPGVAESPVSNKRGIEKSKASSASTSSLATTPLSVSRPESSPAEYTTALMRPAATGEGGDVDSRQSSDSDENGKGASEDIEDKGRKQQPVSPSDIV